MKLTLTFAVLFILIVSAYGQDQGAAKRPKRSLLPIYPWHSFSSIGDIHPWRNQRRKISLRSQALPQQAMTTLTELFPDYPINKEHLPKVSLSEEVEKTDNEHERETEGGTIEEEVYKPPVILVDIPFSPSVLFNPWISGPISRTSFLEMLTPWWKGPNTCEERNEIDESEEEVNGTHLNFSFESTQCLPTENSYVCTKKVQNNGMKKTIITRHQCCYGFIKRTDGRPGCSELKMENLIDTMKNLDASQFVQMTESIGLKQKLLSENFTIFCPTNEAIMDFEDDNEDNEISSVTIASRRTDIVSLTNGHIVEGFQNYDIMDNEQVITSTNGNIIRINKYHGIHTIFTANCVPVATKDNFAQNGIVHLIPEVLDFPTKSIAEIISGDPQFSLLKGFLSKSGLVQSLRDPGKTWTFFAPTDVAFRNMEQAALKRLQEEQECLNSTLKQHIAKKTICSSAISNEILVQNLLENDIVLTKDENGKLHIDGKQIVAKDILATNGILHVIDDVLLPQQAKLILEILHETDRTDLLDLIESADLISTFKEMKNITFFAPCKDALKNVPNSTLIEWRENPRKLREILLYHVASPKTRTATLYNNQELTTLLNDTKIHMKLHEMIPGFITRATVQCARIVDHDNEACGAIVHAIDKVLIPPKNNIMDALQDLDGYDILRRLLQISKMDEKLKETGPFTLLAPSDEAFSHLRDVTMQELLRDETKASEIVKLHILPEMLCCNEVTPIVPFHRQFVRTTDGRLLPLRRSIHNRIKFGRSRAIKCDITANNGVIHTINRVLLPVRHTVFGVDLAQIF